jgi:hypothetical protein
MMSALTATTAETTAGDAPSGAGPLDLRALVLALDAEREHPLASVRARVAQQLAALARTHPTLALATASRWTAEGGAHTASVVRRGLRPLVERRDPTALRVAGYAPEVAVRVRELDLDDTTVALGDELRFSVRIVSGETFAVPVLVEYSLVRCLDDGEVPVGHGRLACRTLGALDAATLTRVHRIPALPSHRWQPGAHALVVSINGRRDALARFTLLAEAPPR